MGHRVDTWAFVCKWCRAPVLPTTPRSCPCSRPTGCGSWPYRGRRPWPPAPRDSRRFRMTSPRLAGVVVFRPPSPVRACTIRRRRRGPRQRAVPRAGGLGVPDDAAPPIVDRGAGCHTEVKRPQLTQRSARRWEWAQLSSSAHESPDHWTAERPASNGMPTNPCLKALGEGPPTLTKRAISPARLGRAAAARGCPRRSTAPGARRS